MFKHYKRLKIVTQNKVFLRVILANFHFQFTLRILKLQWPSIPNIVMSQRR